MANISLRQASAHIRNSRMDRLASGDKADSSLEEALLSSSAPPMSAARKEWLGIKSMLFEPFNALVVFVPIGICAGIFQWSPLWIFTTNFMALLPLANILGDATEELSAGLKNETLGGLLNATFGNAVEMIVSIQSLMLNLITVVKGSLLGSILSNLLLVLGMSFFFGGLGRRNKEQEFLETGPMTNMSMLLLACAAFAVPTVIPHHHHFGSNTSVQLDDTVLSISRVASIFLLLSYIGFLFFQLYTHLEVFESEDDNQAEATMSIWSSMLILLVSTVLVAVNSEFLVGSIEGVVSECNVSASFIGVILLPIIGNACEHVTSVRMAIMDKPVIAIGIAVGSSTQIALFVIPFAVIVGWCMGVHMDLDFNALSVAILVLSVMITLSILVDGKSNWLEGLMLQLTYLIIAVAFWYDPSSDFGAPGAPQ
ncbi:vacuolar calcium ion transporter, putative [Perkinsus marinus ATCC 50983]|uniref:Vacuolar calcium ion transporter, putative n=1 Tax=Perkinsus marinus (strain ATCC 50983 / TXsc) TaxID=423536 RepID=C5KXN6_PERM5|nr:vacuolar calcium ion transporter, putative [Perkinsus marinus ATCC 50983]EER10760.1 vacuolar calcium ion transporter, putative [Perkinsus marinus ATCC 50983]|eukprot:XP_002778965.1 vacuolar calcium ion transporter, putative [Perkinsus marinus ATCC 50983]